MKCTTEMVVEPEITEFIGQCCCVSGGEAN